MTVKRKIEFTVESERLFLVRGQCPAATGCAECAAPTEALTLAAAAMLVQVPEEVVREWLRTRRVHLVGVPDGQLICRRALEACARR